MECQTFQMHLNTLLNVSILLAPLCAVQGTLRLLLQDYNVMGHMGTVSSHLSWHLNVGPRNETQVADNG